MDSKKYKSATSKFFDETEDLELENDTEIETKDISEEINDDQTRVHHVASDVDYDEDEYEDYDEDEYEEYDEDEYEEYDEDEYEEYDEDEYEEYDEDEYEDYDDDDYAVAKKPKHKKNKKKRKGLFKNKKTKYIAIAVAVAVLLLSVVAVIVMAGRVEYVENVEVYVDDTLVHTFDRIDEGTIDQRLIDQGYNEEEYKSDETKKSTETKIYLVQKKEITVTYPEKEWDKEELDVYNYKLSTVLTELEIDLDDNAVVYVDNTKIDNSKFGDTTIRLSSHIKIVNNTVEEEVIDEAIPYSTVETLDSTLPEGERKVVTKGVDGLKRTTYNVYYSNGEEVKRELVSEVVVTAPVDEVVFVGTKKGSDNSSETDE